MNTSIPGGVSCIGGVDAMGLETQSDHNLMRRLRERDEQAFEVLFTRHREMILRHVTGIVRDQDAANDLVQEVFLRVWTHADQWDGRGSFRAWLFRIGTNLSLNHLRSVSRRREQPLEIPADDLDEEKEKLVPGWMVDEATLGPEKAFAVAERQRRFSSLIDQLPEEKRKVLRLMWDEDLDIGEVAATLGIPKGTVRSRLHYAREHLAREWKEMESE